MEWYKLGKHRWKCFNLNSVIIKKKSMANVQQLVKRVPQGVTNISPITAVRAVKSEETGYTLDEILTGFNCCS